jgi:hypothetical protein
MSPRTPCVTSSAWIWTLKLSAGGELGLAPDGEAARATGGRIPPISVMNNASTTAEMVTAELDNHFLLVFTVHLPCRLNRGRVSPPSRDARRRVDF